ncbi:hypothetical protein JD276_15070 [Leucobacter sp. CSA1]|uniref:MmyB-like transcription regulator ligand binding domain-containing protein n=1 Tax=Leucobacter chromiisoli TaxID=2796471 RepID=A0A934UVW7_9MICO|nr:hypothetical protein [Leucobacter chromiisoli]MBK0420350.1 hypothetical protein [Leucobacter chromiisoli]
MNERTTKPKARGREPLRQSLRALLSVISDAPALIRNRQLDLISANPLAHALYEPVLTGYEHPNLARFVFLDDAAQAFFPDWERLADESVHLLRRAVDHDPYDRSLHRLIGELSTRSARFRQRWSAGRMCRARPPSERIRHPFVGELRLVREELSTALDPDVTVTVYLPSAEETTHERLAILTSWSQPDRTPKDHDHHPRKEEST